MSRPIQAIPPELLARDDLVFLFDRAGRPQGCVRMGAGPMDQAPHITAMGTTMFEDDDAIPEGMVWFDADAEMRKLGLLTVLVVPVLLWAAILWIMLP